MQTTEWYTPEWILDIARKTMGHIDLDPFSNPTANATVQADQYYGTQEDGSFIDGLEQLWYGTVFINPPNDKTGKLLKAAWNKAVSEYLAETATDLFWVGYSLEQLQTTQQDTLYSIPGFCHVCLLGKRVKFLRPDGTKGSNGSHGSFLAYRGFHAFKFRRACENYGVCVGN